MRDFVIATRLDHASSSVGRHALGGARNCRHGDDVLPAASEAGCLPRILLLHGCELLLLCSGLSLPRMLLVRPSRISTSPSSARKVPPVSTVFPSS